MVEPAATPLASFDYALPEELIAQEPAAGRGESRLFVLDRRSGKWEHRRFADITRYLRPGDLLVRNDTRVFPARLRLRRPSGGKVELLLLEPAGLEWLALGRPARALKPGSVLRLERAEATAHVLARQAGGVAVQFQRQGQPQAPDEVLKLCEQVGEMPTPPYIHRGEADPRRALDRERYQTIYARRPGAVAAPTAGLHFTPAIFEAASRLGATTVDVTLHVGLGTFQPLTLESLELPTLHAEWVEVCAEAGEAILQARRERRRAVAVGTTSVRALESFLAAPTLPFRQKTEIFIKPGYTFKGVDALITNFHLPRSSLLVLVSAFAGRELILASYQEAIRERYRFYSYGDAMLIH